jgi:hypothetical protein
MFDCSIDKNAPHPSLKGAFAPEAGKIAVYLDKTILQNILGILGLAGVPQAYGIHFGRVLPVQFLLHARVAFQASLD